MEYEPLTPLPARRPDPPPDVSPRSRGVALGLSMLLGWVGGHRFYVGKTATGVLQLLTFGGFGIWTFYDMILIATGTFRDSDDRRIVNWREETVEHVRGLDPQQLRMLIDEMEYNRTDMADLTERVDFLERMLARQRDRGHLPEG